MRDLHLTGVHEDGEHLLLADDDGAGYRLRMDEPLRAATRRPSVSAASPRGGSGTGLGPRQVQAMIRAGASAEEAAERAGWPIEKVHKYDGPILAERDHVATLARASRLRGRAGETDTTLGERVAQRLTARGVDPEQIVWDAWRSEDGQWTVEVTFAAGGRRRTGAWAFSRTAMTPAPRDDESRWLTGDADVDPTTEHVVGGSQVRSPRARPAVPRRRGSSEPRDAGSGADDGTAASPAPAQDRDEPAEPTIFSALDPDEASAGVAALGEVTEEAPTVGRPAPAGAAAFDLADSVRERSGARQRKRTGQAKPRAPRLAVSPAAPGAASPSSVPPVTRMPTDEALPLADLRYDPETMAPPPGAHSHPQARVDDRPAVTDASPRPTPRTAAPAPAAEPVPHPVAEPDAEPAAEPEAEPAAEPEAVSAAEPEAEPAAESPPPADAPREREPSPPALRAPAPSRAKPAPRRATKGRASVPSWDDIILGTKPPE